METIDVIIETPKGSIQKYNYDEENKCFRLKKMLPLGMQFPFDFGFIPNTLGGDGDALDVIVISEAASFTGCVMDCRIIGCITAEQNVNNEVYRNDRFLAAPVASLLYSNVRSIKQLDEKLLHQLESFFVNYNELENKKFKPLERLDAQEALNLIKENRRN